MTTRKAPTKAATKAAILKFNPDWIKDPPPPFFRNLDRVAQRQLTQAKRDFTNKVKDILKTGQR
jgi:hypothetical protein